MNFKGHLVVGTIVGLSTGYIISKFLDISIKMQIQITSLIIIFSLLPDLDTNSIPKKWFYRLIFSILFYLAITKQFEAATIIALVSLAPLLSHHRGWTHNFFSALLLPTFLILTYSFFSSNLPYYKFFTIYNMKLILFAHIWIIFSCTLGWVIHLIVDHVKLR